MQLTSADTTMRYLVSALILFNLLLNTQGIAPYVGDGGYALSFDHRRADLIGFQWSTLPLHNVTVEWWMNIVDPWVEEQTVLAYSAYDATRSPAYDNANEFHFRCKRTGATISRASDTVTCLSSDVPDCNFFEVGWVHVAFTWTSSTGDVKLFKNGQLIWSVRQNSTGSGFIRPIVPNGCFHFTQEADTFCGGFDEYQSLHGLVDEFRVWDYVRTPEDIAATYNLSISNYQGLNLYWKFDDFGSAIASDSSGNGNNGVLGKLPDIKNVATYVTDRGNVAPTDPSYIISHAPVFGSGRIGAFLPSPGATITIPLHTIDLDTLVLNVTISRLPSSGTLHQIDTNNLINVIGTTVIDNTATSQTLRIIYISNSNFIEDSFDFSVDDGTSVVTGTVDIILSDPLTAPNVTVSIEEDNWAVIVLGEINNQGELVNSMVSGVPPKGKLFQAKFIEGSPQTYLTLIKNEDQLDQISMPSNVTNMMGIVLYLPEQDEYEINGTYTTLRYRLYDNHTTPVAISDESVVSIGVSPVNDPPVAISADTTISATNQMRILTLQSTDVDTNFSPRPFYRITQWPKMGNLYQVTYQSTKGVKILPIRPATVISWAVEVKNFSSQFSRCRCFFPPPDLDECIIREGCANFGYNAIQALGPPDIFPQYGDKAQAYQPMLDRGPEFIELEFENDVYLTEVDIYETFKPGAVVRLLVASQYNGELTQWTTVWSGSTQLVPEVARIFSPPVCPHEVPIRFVRVEIDGTWPGWNSYDAFKLTGNIELPRGKVLNPDGKFIYEPRQGIHIASGHLFDTILFRASDCESESSDGQISIFYTGTPSDDDSTTFLNIEVLADAKTRTSVDIAVDSIRTDYANALGLQLNQTGQPTIQIFKASRNLKISSDSGNIDSFPRIVSNSITVLPDTSSGSHYMQVWITFGNYTYRVGYNINVAEEDKPNVALIASLSTIGGVLLIVLAAGNIYFFVYLKRNKSKVLHPPDFRVVEFGEDYKKIPNLSKNKLLLLYSLEDLLLRVEFASLLINKMKAEDLNEDILKSVFYVYRANNKAIQLVSHFARSEIAATNSIETLFREDSICTKLFRRYTRVVGLKYLWDTLAVMLNELQSVDDNSSPQSTGTGSSDTLDTIKLTSNFEIDPSKFSETDDAKINKLNLLLLCQRTFFAITHSVERFPLELKDSLILIRNEVIKKYPDVEVSSYVGGFVFLRWFCPAIIAPHNYGLYEVPPSAKSQRVLILLSKVLQNLSNGLLFEGKEEFMTKLNDFITSNIEEVKLFLNQVSTNKLSKGELRIEVDAEGKITEDDVIPEAVHRNSLIILNDIIRKNSNEMLSLVSEHFPVTESEEIKKQLNLILSTSSD